VLTRYVNSNQTKVRGVDVDARYAHKLPENWGMATVDLKYTHLFEWLRTESDGRPSREFAGTHGNCDVTNCTGTPDNKANLRFGWERNDWRVSLNIQLPRQAGKQAVPGRSRLRQPLRRRPRCTEWLRTSSFTTFDLVARWKPAPRWEVFGSVQNVFDKVAPLDPLTYGAQAYNPLDYEGARGRYYELGARYTF
jgi:iron complex outermembrane receptor protein